MNLIQPLKCSWRLHSVKASAIGTILFGIIAALADNWVTVAPWLGVIMKPRAIAIMASVVSLITFIVRHLPQPDAMPPQPKADR